jgi:hypothetical protein
MPSIKETPHLDIARGSVPWARQIEIWFGRCEASPKPAPQSHDYQQLRAVQVLFADWDTRIEKMLTQNKEHA